MPPIPTENPDLPPAQKESNRQQSVVEQLTTLAYALGPEARLPTFVELRKTLGVSVTTLVSALDDLEARGVITRKHGVGIFVSRDALRCNIAMLCSAHFFQGDTAVSPFWSLFVQQVWKCVRENGDQFALYFVAAHEDDHEEIGIGVPKAIGDRLALDIKQGSIQGVIGAGLSPCVSYWLQQIAIPFVAFAGYAPHHVQLDVVSGVQRGTEALIASGCRKIGFWTASLAQSDNIQVFRRTLEQAGIPYDPALLQCRQGDEDSSLTNLHLGERAVRNTFEHSITSPPEGVLCDDDMLARGALPLLAQKGIRIGKDLRFATQTNAGSPLLFGYEEGLIQIEMEPARLAKEMITLLQAQIVGKETKEGFVLLAPTLRLPTST
jgi:DNA-binding LacI/PurR family transcriptional regulator